MIFSLFFSIFISSSKQGTHLYGFVLLLSSSSALEMCCDSLVFACIPSVVTKVITVVETVVDGRVVETSKTVDVDVDQIE